MYATATFDSFLNNLTRYIFSKDPSRILKNTSVEVRQLLSKTRAEILSERIESAASAFARKSFSERINELGNILGVKFDIEMNDIKELNRISSLRNRIVHNAVSFNFSIDNNLSVNFDGMNALHENDLNVDVKTFAIVADGIYRSVIKNFEKRDLLMVELNCLDAITFRANK